MKNFNNLNNVTANYREVSVDVGGIEKKYKNPLTKLYQHEYALFTAVSELFASVICDSMCVESLMLYFKELPQGNQESTEYAASTPGRKRLTQENLLKGVRIAASEKVQGHITFPMMNICAANAYTKLNSDGTHTFIFTDGIYAFSVRLKMQGRGSDFRLEVKDLPPVRAVEGGKGTKKPKRTKRTVA